MLKISGRPWRASASSSARMQKSPPGCRQIPGQHVAAGPVDHRDQVDKAAGHGNVGDVHGPDLARPIDLQPAQQVGIDRMAGVFLLVFGHR